MERFRFAADILNLDEGMFQYLASPVKQVIVSVPIVMMMVKLKYLKATA